MLMKRLLSRENLLKALKQVEKNKGSHGMDGMSVEFLREHIQGTLDFREHCDYLVDRILNMYDDQAPLRFYDHVPIRDKMTTHTNAGLLGGVSGIALVLLSLIHDDDPDWDSVFLIS
ncbi:hypothetical protein [Baia soyae]|uniref:Lanthionine synthetase-like protein n=1 Tax=Baia soyae TaxID=1544746 RepID=A0A4R2RZ09_9BACL|nr:hypothetical protein [Baia soyae]TCP68329.1 hypothetical protein EDD57_11716 [Baia soyae]